MGINTFAQNRSKFRKVYPYRATRRPDVREFVDTYTETTKSFDFQKIIRDRDYFLINQRQALIFPPPEPAILEYLEVTVGTPSGSITSFPVTFPIPFTGTPYLAFQTSQSVFVGDGEEAPHLAWWVTGLTTLGFTASFSAPFTGSITYRGVYNEGSYPAYVNRITDHSGSFGWVSAGSVTLTGQSSVTMSWAALPSLPEFVNYNPVGSTSDTDLDIGQNISAVNASSAVNDLSIEFNGTIHFLALDTDSLDSAPFSADADDP